MRGAVRQDTRARRGAVRGLVLVVLALGLVAPRLARAAPALDVSTMSRWGLADGLPQSSVTSLVQAQDGYVWLTTFGGIARFDGVSFTVFNLANTPQLGTNRFLSSYRGPSGTLWFGGTTGELVRYRHGRFDAIRLPDTVVREVWGLVEDERGVFYATTTDALIVVTGDEVEVTALSSVTWGLGLASDGSLWAAANQGAVCLRGPCPADAPVRPLGLRRLTGSPVVRDRTGRLWVVDATSVWSLAAGARAPTVEFTLDVPASPGLRAIAIDDRRGRVWVAADQRLWRRDGDGGAWTEVPVSAIDPLLRPGDVIRSLLVDREGALWIGADRGGVLRVREPDTEQFGADAGLGDAAFSVLEDRAGRQWVTGTCKPVRRRDGGRFAPTDDGRARCPTALALADDGAVWIGDDVRVVRYGGGDEPASVIDLGLGLVATHVFALAFDEAQTLWIGTDGYGLTRADRGADGTYHLGRWWRAADGLGGDRVRVVTPVPASAGGGVWIGTDAGAARMTADGHLTAYAARDGLAAGIIRDIQLGADGATWFGSYGGGLSRLRDGRFVTFTSRQGLCDDTVSRVIEVDGTLWMNGNRGVSRVALADLDQVAAGVRPEVRCSLLQTGEGNGGVQPSGWRGADGSLWFPTIDGVVRIDPRAAAGPDQPPLVVIEDVTNDGRPLARDASGVQRIAPGRSDVDVRYTGLAFDAPAQLRFRHRLLGRDRGWIDAGTRRSVSYTRLPPGTYTFEVTVQNRRGEWAEPARFRFAIAPHLWQTAWFPFAAGALGLLLTAGLVQLRVRAVRQRNRLLQAEVIERQTAEAQAREQERHYRTLFEGTTDGLFVHDPRGRLVEVNAAACALVGLPRATLLARGLEASLAVEHGDRLRDLIADCTATRASRAVEVTLIRGDDSLRELRVQATPFDIGGVTHAFCAAVDLTDARRAEAQRRDYERRLQQGQKLEALGLLAGGIAHDFNNHLAAIGTSATIIRAAVTDPVVASSAADIHQSVERAGALIHQLLVFGRRQPGNVKELDADRAITALTPILRRLLPDEIELRHQALGPPATIGFDPVELEQSVMNLVVNARDAMPSGGVITITTTLRDVDADLAGAHAVAPGRFAVIEVADTGHGMDARTRERMFDPFFTTKALGKGTGLGLSIIHAAVAKAGGFILVESTVGVGTRFRLHLPMIAGEATGDEPRAPAQVAPTAASGRTILLCEDAELVRRSITRLLELNGHRVVEVATPRRALAMFADEPDRFDLVLSDVVLPVWSGPELARRLRELRPTLPVVLMSGHTLDVVIDALDQRTTFVKKPFSSEELEAAIAAAVGHADATAS